VEVFSTATAHFAAQKQLTYYLPIGDDSLDVIHQFLLFVIGIHAFTLLKIVYFFIKWLLHN
jgi:hypothetical protein